MRDPFKYTSWRELLEEIKKLSPEVLDTRVTVCLDENYADNLKAGDLLPMYSFRVLQKDDEDIGGDTLDMGTLVLEPRDNGHLSP